MTFNPDQYEKFAAAQLAKSEVKTTMTIDLDEIERLAQRKPPYEDVVLSPHIVTTLIARVRAAEAQNEKMREALIGIRSDVGRELYPEDRAEVLAEIDAALSRLDEKEP